MSRPESNVLWKYNAIARIETLNIQILKLPPFELNI